MARLHHPRTRLLRAFVLVFSLLLLWNGSALAEFKTLNLPKPKEFQIDLSAIVQDTPPVPVVVKEDDHYIFTGLEAWGIDRKYMSTFRVDINPVTGPTIRSDKDQLEDRMVVYCNDLFWEEHEFPVKIGQQDGKICLSPSSPQNTMYLQFPDKKDRTYTWRFFGNGDVTIINGKDRSEATYEAGILKEAFYSHNSGKVTGTYIIRNGGMVNGEYCYTLKELTVSSKTEKLDEDNRWNKITGWKNPEDQKIRAFTATEFPFTFTSTAGTPFRVIPPVMSIEKEPVAENLAAFSRTPVERKLYPTLADFGFPEFPAYEVDKNSNDCHITGLARWGAPEDELTVPLGVSPAYSYVPDIPGIQQIVIWYSKNFPVLSISLFMKEGSFSTYNYYGNYEVSVNSPGKELVEYHYMGGYLYTYSLMTNNSYHFHYEPAFALNDSTQAEGVLPPFRCYMITNALNVSERWNYDHGEWIGEAGPCPFDDSQVPPALTYDSE